MPRAPKPDEPTGLSKEDIEQLIEKAVAAAVAGIKNEFTELFSLKLDSIQQELKAKNDEISELRQLRDLASPKPSNRASGRSRCLFSC